MSDDYIKYRSGETSEDIDEAVLYNTYDEALDAAEKSFKKREDGKPRFVTGPVDADNPDNLPTLIYGINGELYGLRMPNGQFYDVGSLHDKIER